MVGSWFETPRKNWTITENPNWNSCYKIFYQASSYDFRLRSRYSDVPPVLPSQEALSLSVLGGGWSVVWNAAKKTDSNHENSVFSDFACISVNFSSFPDRFLGDIDIQWVLTASPVPENTCTECFWQWNSTRLERREENEPNLLERGFPIENTMKHSQNRKIHDFWCLSAVLRSQWSRDTSGMPKGCFWHLWDAYSC